MRRAATGLLVAALAVHLEAIARIGRAGSATPEARQESPQEFRRVCVRCHASDRVMEGRRYRSQWEEVLDRMVERGATGSDQDFEVILEYLVSEFGRVSINVAAADEIVQVLHLDAAAAEAIVQHRSKHGKFVDFDALAGVPGVPVEELQKRRDAIVFQ